MNDLERYRTAEVDEVEFVNYGVKIKTLRLTNNELHMIYNDDSEDDFENDFEQSDEEEEGRGRFDDERYVEVVKKAINTNLEHVEVSGFRLFSFVCVVLSFGVMFYEMLASNDIYTSMAGYTRNNFYRAQESMYLNDMVASTLRPNFTTEQFSQLGTNLSQHNIQF